MLDLGLSHRQTVFAIYGLCLVLAVLALALSGVTQLYAFLGVFLAFGLVLFIPTRGALRRPEELEATTYDEDPPRPVADDDPHDADILAPPCGRSDARDPSRLTQDFRTGDGCQRSLSVGCSAVRSVAVGRCRGRC
jgi:hypothetical protein